jgi:hypothetical protein
VAPPLLRAGATLSEAESLQRFASPAHANAPIQTIDVQTAVSARNRVYVDLRPPAEQARTGAHDQDSLTPRPLTAPTTLHIGAELAAVRTRRATSAQPARRAARSALRRCLTGAWAHAQARSAAP